MNQFNLKTRTYADFAVLSDMNKGLAMSSSSSTQNRVLPDQSFIFKNEQKVILNSPKEQKQGASEVDGGGRKVRGKLELSEDVNNFKSVSPFAPQATLGEHEQYAKTARGIDFRRSFGIVPSNELKATKVVHTTLDYS